MAGMDFLRNGVEGALHYAPLVSSAAVDEDHFCENINLVIARAVSVLALPMIALLGLGWAFPQISRLGNPRMVAISLNCLSLLSFVFERWRAGVAVDQLAAKKYEEEETPSVKVMKHLCTNVRAFRYLKIDIDKKDPEGTLLIDRLFSPVKWYSSVREIAVDKVEDWLTDLRLDGKNFLMLAVGSRDEALLESLLGPKGKIAVASLTEQQQGDVWTEVKTVRMFKLLCQYGFNINARNSAGLTPLMHWAKSREVRNSFQDDEVFELVIAALNAGANPLLEQDGQKASDLALENSLEHLFLLQGEQELQRSKIPLLQEEGFFAKFPWSSLVINDSNWQDAYGAEKQFFARLSFPITIAHLLSDKGKWLSLSDSTIKVARTVEVAFCLIALVLAPLEIWRSGYEVRRHAANDYRTKIIPSTQAVDIISRDVEASLLALKGVSEERRLLTKLGEDGLAPYTKRI